MLDFFKCLCIKHLHRKLAHAGYDNFVEGNHRFDNVPQAVNATYGSIIACLCIYEHLYCYCFQIALKLFYDQSWFFASNWKYKHPINLLSVWREAMKHRMFYNHQAVLHMNHMFQKMIIYFQCVCTAKCQFTWRRYPMQRWFRQIKDLPPPLITFNGAKGNSSYELP